ncbi:hypothetical protein L1049_000167 [Liquidambar formosana]|uniref:Uncharacterized protein n=1 Tax=Liquidambar formosana TaxID=63359 RepID=A0AAP0NA32_LIQFO
MTSSIQDFNYSNKMVLGNDANLQIVNQMIDFNKSVYAKLPSFTHLIKSFKRFPFYLYSNYLDQGDGTYLSTANLTLGFNEKKSKSIGNGLSESSLENLQNGQGSMLVKNNLVISGLGSTQQDYSYDSSKFCYFRNVSSSNYTILYDKVGNTCSQRTQPRFDLCLAGGGLFPGRRAFLASDPHDNNKGV